MSIEYVSTSCPICGSANLVDLGPILHAVPTLVNYWPIDLAGLEFRLLGCPRCDFWFKQPSIPMEKLLECYTKGAKLSQQSPADRSFHSIVSLVHQFSPGKRLLDIGCDTGALLDQFDDTWQKFGIEPSARAGQIAKERGVTILGSTLDDRSQGWGEFDAVLLIDVMEHLPRPLELLKKARDLLNPGGIIVLVTGDTSAWPFRLERNLYWYATITEHVSFYSPKTINYLANELAMTLARYERRPHTKSLVRRQIAQGIKQFIYLGMRSVRGFGLPPLRSLFVNRAAPSWFGARDHMFVALKSKDGP